MGLCGSKVPAQYKDEVDAARAADRMQALSEQADSKVVKLLLLGTGDSGKSTIFKQMRILYGKGFSHEDLLAAAPLIRSNCVEAIRTLVEQADVFGDSCSLRREAEQVMELSPDSPLDPATGALIQRVWSDAAVQRTYEKRSQFQLVECARVFLESIARIAAPDYVPTIADVLHARKTTSGMYCEQYLISGTEFQYARHARGGPGRILTRRVAASTTWAASGTSARSGSTTLTESPPWCSWRPCPVRRELGPDLPRQLARPLTSPPRAAAQSTTRRCTSTRTRTGWSNRSTCSATLSTARESLRCPRRPHPFTARPPSPSWFGDKSVILFMNKQDLLVQKLQRHDIRQPDKDLFMDYTAGCMRGPEDTETQKAAQDYLKTLYIGQVMSKAERVS